MKMLNALAIALFALASGLPNAGATVETSSFRLAFPPGWQRIPEASPPRLSGPDRTLVTGSSVSVTGNPNDSDGVIARGKAIEASHEAVRKTTAGARMAVQMPWRKSGLPDGAILHETIVTSEDRLTYLAACLLSGKGGVVLLTVEGPAQTIKNYTQVRSSLLAIAWK